MAWRCALPVANAGSESACRICTAAPIGAAAQGSNCWYYSRTTTSNKYGRARDAKRTGDERNCNSDHRNTQQWDPWVSLRVLQLVSSLGENNQLCPTF